MSQATSPLGLSVIPSHGLKSVVTGIRLYLANTNPSADPVMYSISGRISPTSSVANSIDSLCWSVDASFMLVGNTACDASALNQKIYMTKLGEIRVKSHPGFCLNALYGSYYKMARFTTCYSDYGDEVSDSFLVQKFSYSPITRNLQNSNSYFGVTCASYDRKNGHISQKTCSSSASDQKFIISDQTGNWTLISEGSFPWVPEIDRNPVGVEILSTYDEGDKSLYFVEVRLYNSTTPYDEYKLLFPKTRDPNSLMLEFAELELPGLLLPAGNVSLPGTNSSLVETLTRAPTRKPTRAPTRKPSQKPTLKPILISTPTRKPTPLPTRKPVRK